MKSLVLEEYGKGAMMMVGGSIISETRTSPILFCKTISCINPFCDNAIRESPSIIRQILVPIQFGCNKRLGERNWSPEARNKFISASVLPRRPPQSIAHADMQMYNGLGCTK